MTDYSTQDKKRSIIHCHHPSNQMRIFTGHEVSDLFEETGIKVTKPLISIISGLLTEYNEDIQNRFDFPELISELIGKIYSKSWKQFLHYQDKARVLYEIMKYKVKNEKSPLFSDISKNVGLNEYALIPLLIELYKERLIDLVSESLPLQKVVTAEPYFQVDITRRGVKFLRTDY